MGDLINLDEYREQKELEQQEHEWTDEQLSRLLLDILYLDLMGADPIDISDAVMEKIKNEAKEYKEED